MSDRDFQIKGYSVRSFFWKVVPHKHYRTATVQGFVLGQAEPIRGYQCLRCWRSVNAQGEPDARGE